MVSHIWQFADTHSSDVARMSSGGEVSTANYATSFLREQLDGAAGFDG